MWDAPSAIADAKDKVMLNFRSFRANLEEVVNKTRDAEVECAGLAGDNPSVFQPRLQTLQARAQGLYALNSLPEEMTTYKQSVQDGHLPYPCVKEFFEELVSVMSLETAGKTVGDDAVGPSELKASVDAWMMRQEPIMKYVSVVNSAVNSFAKDVVGCITGGFRGQPQPLGRSRSENWPQ